jgi:hypothetical protein
MKTPKGTELPILNLRGKDYLEVKYRILWFREERPDWTIQTQLVEVTATSALAKATISDASGRVISTSHKFEDKQGFGDFIEKAETGSIGRALALIGYGTQFCADEFDEGERIVDAPLSREHKVKTMTESIQPQYGESEKPAGCVPRCEKMLVSKFNPNELYCPKCKRKEKKAA